MMLEKINSQNNFTPFNQFKRFHKITFIGYEFVVNGNKIEFEERISPQQLDIKDGDMFVAKINNSGQVILERAEFY